MKLAIPALLMTAALLAGTIECVASCAAINCESPCHRDKQAPDNQVPAACSHELVLDRVHAPAIGQGFEARGAMQTPLPTNPRPDWRGCNAFSSALHAAMSRDRQAAGSSLNLRI